MIERFLGLDMTGIYTTVFYFATLIIMPSRAMLRIVGPVVSDAWNSSDMDKLSEIYRKSALNLFIAGMLLFAGIWGNVDNIFRILPDVYAQGKWVILLIGIAYLFDMLTGGAQQILANSKYYRFQTYFMALQIVLAIATNLSLIPLLGITGAALASTITKLIVNSGRYTFLWRKFRLQPYNYKFLLVLIAGASSYGASLLLHEMDNLVIDILLRSVIILVIFAIIILATGVSEDINNTFRKILKLNRPR
jgi:O-antigen/teichoic acid export membrane protein